MTLAADPRLGPRTESGHATGLAATTGIPFDPGEQTPELQWPLNVIVYDRMRRQDAQVKSILNAVTLPIRRTRWRIDPNGADPETVARPLADDLGITLTIDAPTATVRRSRDRGRFSWSKHVRLALLSLPYGHMPFEKVGEIGDDGHWHLTKLGERLPPTIARMNVGRSGDLISIEQYPSGLPGNAGPLDEMKADHLVMYAHEREGGLWAGTSILRSAYRNWLIKDRLIRVDAIKHERNGLGVPDIEAPPNASAKMIQELRDIASAFRVGETSGMALPNGATLRLVGVQGTLPDTLASVKYHDEQIAREALAQFLELITSTHGSRALATSFIDFFIMSLQAVADEIAESFNEQLVEDYVDWNFGGSTPVPKLVCDEIGTDTALTAQAVSQLVTSGALVADEALDAWIRENYKLPPRSGPENPPPPTFETPPGAPPVAAGRRRRPFLATSPGNTGNAPEWPGRRYLRRLTSYYGTRVREALAAIIGDPHAIAAAVIVDGHDPHVLGSIVTLDAVDLDGTLRDAWADSYLAGGHAADLQLKAARKVAAVRIHRAQGDENIIEEVDWEAWEPGSPDAAALLAADPDGGLAQLLGDADVTIRGIEGTTLDDLGNVLAALVETGASVDEAADAILAFVDDPYRAEMIAQTEIARAMTTSTLDRYEEHGVAGQDWLLSDGACPLCEENEAAAPIPLDEDWPNGAPPVHPWCVCAVAPAFQVGDDLVAYDLTDPSEED